MSRRSSVCGHESADEIADARGGLEREESDWNRHTLRGRAISLYLDRERMAVGRAEGLIGMNVPLEYWSIIHRLLPKHVFEARRKESRL